jgi:ElaB/YqjD/DUF883 family membrane-anchored ribosome-binding protein
MATAKTPTTEDLVAQVEALKGDIATLTKMITELGRAKGDDLAGTVRQRAEHARDAGAAQLDEMQKQVLAGAESAEDYVRHNPAVALGLAAGIGVLVGLLTARR